MTDTPNLVKFDADTGELIYWSTPISAATAYNIAAAVLPGMPPEEIERAYRAWLEDDSPSNEPFAVGKAVGHRELATMRGNVVRRLLDDAGLLHTVEVRWAMGTTGIYSPVELVEVS